MTKLNEDSLLDLVAYIREQVANETTSTAIVFRITASGRVNDGEFAIKFSLENEYDNDSNVHGGSFEAVLEEYIRRNSWQKRNAPLCLPKVGARASASAPAPLDDEIPF